MKRFTKDAIAIFIGALLGVVAIRAFLTHPAPYLWILGVVIGGAAGYLTRMLTEPQRIASATKKAWQSVTSWKPRPKWKRIGIFFKNFLFVSISGLGAGIIFGHIMFPIVGISDLHSGGFFLLELEYRISVIMLIILAHSVWLISYTFTEKITNIDEDVNSAVKYLNPISIHIIAAYYILRFVARYGWRIPIAAIMAAFMAVIFCLQLIGNFFKFVHHSNFTACGIYAATLSAIVAFVVPANLFLTGGALMIGALLGACARQAHIHLCPQAFVPAAAKA